jgi:hypothetical protein
LFFLRERILFALNHLVHRSVDANKCHSFVQILRAVEWTELSECYFEVIRERKQFYHGWIETIEIPFYLDTMDDDVYDDETANHDNDDEEQFQIQTGANDNNYVLVNTRIDYQHRSDILNSMCLYDFVSTMYKKTMNATDLEYLTRVAAPSDETVHRKGRPPNKRYPFQNQHPQASTHLLIEHSQSRIPVLYGPQIPRRDRDDTQERYSRALLTLFVPWRTVSDLCNSGQTWQDALQAAQALISTNSRKIIENIQLLHECKKDRDEHLLQVIAEAQADNGSIDLMVLPANPAIHGEYDDLDNSDELLELLGGLDEYTTAAANASKKSTENVYIEETIEAVENVGRFTDMQGKPFCERHHRD